MESRQGTFRRPDCSTNFRLPTVLTRNSAAHWITANRNRRAPTHRNWASGTAAIRGSHCAGPKAPRSQCAGWHGQVSSPSRYIALSVPADATGAMGRSCPLWNCARKQTPHQDPRRYPPSACIFALRTRSYGRRRFRPATDPPPNSSPPARHPPMRSFRLHLITAPTAP